MRHLLVSLHRFVHLNSYEWMQTKHFDSKDVKLYSFYAGKKKEAWNIKTFLYFQHKKRKKIVIKMYNFCLLIFHFHLIFYTCFTIHIDVVLLLLVLLLLVCVMLLFPVKEQFFQRIKSNERRKSKWNMASKKNTEIKDKIKCDIIITVHNTFFTILRTQFPVRNYKKELFGTIKWPIFELEILR